MSLHSKSHPLSDFGAAGAELGSGRKSKVTACPSLLLANDS